MDDVLLIEVRSEQVCMEYIYVCVGDGTVFLFGQFNMRCY